MPSLRATSFAVELSRYVRLPLVFYSNDVNGLQEGAARWVQAVEAATLRSDLRYLTLLQFRNLFPPSSTTSQL